jgi:branched-chain amino acid transport system substrate-binding protein
MIVLISIVVGVLLVVASSGQAAGETTSQAAVPPPPGFPVKIGVVVPLSGNVKSFGESTRNGVSIALQQAEDAGWNIETVYADSKCDAQQAISVTEDLIINQGVHYIIGAVCSSASIPMSEIAEENQVVQISPVSTNPQVTKYNDGTNKEYVFRACFLDPFQGKVMATFAKEDLSATNAAVLYDEGNDYVSGLAQYFKGYFEDVGGNVPAFEPYTSGTTDFSALLTQVNNANVDVLFLPDNFSTVNDIAEQADAMNFQPTFLGADGWDSPNLQRDLLEGAYFSTHFWPGDPRQIVVDFVETYTTTHDTRPDALAALGYDATGILLQAIEDASVDDATRVKDAMDDVLYEGLTGEIAFEKYGDPLKQAAIVKIAGGEAHLEKYVALHVSGLTASNDCPTDLGNSTTFTATIESGGNVTYTWTYGDGTIESGSVVSHTYGTAGAYTAIVTASNEYNSRTAQTVAVVRETVNVTNTGSVTTSDEVLSLAAGPETTRTVSVTYTPQAATTRSPGDFEVAGGITFHLEARDEEGKVVTETSNLTMTIHYDEDALPSYLKEENLEVRRYDEASGDWVPLEVMNRNLERDRITVRLDHFSEFGLMGPVKRVYLPLVMRNH